MEGDFLFDAILTSEIALEIIVLFFRLEDDLESRLEFIEADRLLILSWSSAAEGLDLKLEDTEGSETDEPGLIKENEISE